MTSQTSGRGQGPHGGRFARCRSRAVGVTGRSVGRISTRGVLSRVRAGCVPRSAPDFHGGRLCGRTGWACRVPLRCLRCGSNTRLPGTPVKAVALTHVHAADEGAAPLVSQVGGYLRVPRIRSWATRPRAPCMAGLSRYHGARRLDYRKPSPQSANSGNRGGFRLPWEAVVGPSVGHAQGWGLLPHAPKNSEVDAIHGPLPRCEGVLGGRSTSTGVSLPPCPLAVYGAYREGPRPRSGRGSRRVRST